MPRRRRSQTRKTGGSWKPTSRRFPSERVLVAAGAALLVAALALDLFVYRSSAPPTTTIAPRPQQFEIATAGVPAPGPYSARLVWTTTGPATGTVEWAPTGMRPLVRSTALRSSARHVVTLDALAANTSYDVRLSVRAPSGERIATTIRFRTAPAPSTIAAEVRDGAIRVNGGAFFPLIAWLQCADRWPASIAEGIDLFAGNGCTSLAALTQTIAGRALAAGTSDDAVIDAPALLGWFLPDEADARGLTGATLAPSTQPGLHFLTLTQHFFAGAAPLPSGREMYPGLVARADVVGFDLYPLQELCRTDFLPAVFDAQQALVTLAPGKPTFQWIEVRELKCPAVAVTPATVRAESWLAIAGGAHGLGFFPKDWDPQVGAAIAGISARIRQLGPVLLAPARPLATGLPAVRASERIYHGVRYVIAVNAGDRAATVTLAGRRLRLRPLGVRFVMIGT